MTPSYPKEGYIITLITLIILIIVITLVTVVTIITVMTLVTQIILIIVITLITLVVLITLITVRMGSTAGEVLGTSLCLKQQFANNAFVFILFLRKLLRKSVFKCYNIVTT